MTDIVLTEIKSGFNLSKINDNFDTIEAVINDEMVHNIGGNNVMQQDLDINSNRILNVPAPSSDTDLVRKIDVSSLTAGIPLIDVDRVRPHDTVASMVADITLLAGDLVQTANYYSTSTGGSGLYIIKTAAQATIDGDVINTFSNHTLANSGVAILDINDTANVEQFGARGAASVGAAIQAAADFCVANKTKLYARRTGVAYAIDIAIDLRSVEHIEFLEDIDTAAVTTEIPVTIGGFAVSGTPDIEMATVLAGNVFGATPTFPQLRIWGAKSGTFILGASNYIQLYADAAEPTGTSNAYNRIELNGVCKRFEITSAVGFSWITENQIYRGRIVEMFITNGGGYAHNHNKFIDNTFEGADVDIQFNDVVANSILGARFETVSAGSLTFDAASGFNKVEKSWSGQLNPRNEFVSNFIPTTDSGFGNQVTTESGYRFNQVPICELNASSGVVGNTLFAAAYDPNILPDFVLNGIGGQNFLTPGLNELVLSANRWVFISDLIPVQFGDVVSFDFEHTGNLMRPWINVYDSNQKLLVSEGGGGAFWSQPSLTFDATNGAYRPVADLSNAETSGAVARTEVAYIRVSFFSGAGGNFRHIGATLHTQTLQRGLANGSARIQSSGLAIEGAPTQGYLPKYTHVRDVTANTVYENNFQHETQLTAAEIATSTSIEVDTISTVANGDIVGILLDDGTTHWSAVSGLAGSIFTVDALPSGASLGNRVVFNRWTLLV